MGKSNTVPVLSCFLSLLPSTLNHLCLLDKCPSSSPHPVLGLSIIACSCVQQGISAGLRRQHSGSLLQIQSVHKAKPDFQHLERLMLYEGRGLSGLWGGGSLAHVAAWWSVVWCDRSLLPTWALQELKPPSHSFIKEIFSSLSFKWTRTLFFHTFSLWFSSEIFLQVFY